jgi:hypothetical protein
MDGNRVVSHPNNGPAPRASIFAQKLPTEFSRIGVRDSAQSGVATHFGVGQQERNAHNGKKNKKHRTGKGERIEGVDRDS